MDPPLAMHRKSKNGKTNWTCPIHMELGMTAVNLPKPFGKVPIQDVTFTGEPFDDPIEMTGVTSLLIPTPNNALPEQSDPGRELKVRRPKNWTASKRSYERGYKNNGLIVVENDPSDGEIEVEKGQHGVIDRFQEKGIKLDFIDRVHKYASDLHLIAVHVLTCATVPTTPAASTVWSKSTNLQSKNFATSWPIKLRPLTLLSTLSVP